MKNYLLFLLWLVALSSITEAIEKEEASTVFRDEGSLLLDLRQFNASKHVSLVHDGVRYHIYTGGKGSGVRYFNGFIFRETDKTFILVSQVSYTPFTKAGYLPIVSLTPEIDKTGIQFLARSARQMGNKEFIVAREDFTKLEKVAKEGIAYRPIVYPSEEYLR